MKMKNKYHNKITYTFGRKFDSKKERDRYFVLLDMMNKGEITKLDLQKRFVLQEGFYYEGKKQRAITYIVDFFYYDNKLKCYVAEDVKSKVTRQDSTYRIKCKMFMYQYPNIAFKEVL